MKILYLNPLILYPPLQGNQMTGLNRVKCLSKNHQVTLICFYTDKSQLKQQLQQLQQYCHRIIPVYLPKWQSYFQVILGFTFSKKPLQLSYYHSKKLVQVLKEVAPGVYDIIHVNTLRMEQFVNPQMQVPVLVDLHDSMILNIQSRLKKETGLYKFMYTVELKRIKEYENSVVKKYPHLMVLAEQDKMMHNNNPKIDVIHLGVDTLFFKRAKELPANGILIFTGNMNYTPNVDAVIWFIENCWQQILEKIPGARFRIAGANPSKHLDKYRAYKNIEIAGNVNSMPDALNEAQVAIAPLQSGSGMQNKILEAMACAIPTVCTSIGLGNINAVDEESILIADDANTFAVKCIGLLQDYAKCKTIGRNAAVVIKNFYSIEQHCQSLEELYKKIISVQANKTQ